MSMNSGSIHDAGILCSYTVAYADDLSYEGNCYFDSAGGRFNTSVYNGAWLSSENNLLPPGRQVFRLIQGFLKSVPFTSV